MEIEAPPSSPALDAAREEYAKLIADPATRWDKQTNARADALYQKTLAHPAAPPPSVPVTIGGNESVTIGAQGASLTTDFSGDAEAQAEVETALRAELGDSYDATMQEMASGAKYLFDGEEGQHALTWLTHRISGDPRAEALGIKFLADLSKLQQGGR
jgi:hypothetical protein